MEIFSDPNTYISLLTLTVMEIVLGIDNIVFIAIICGRLPKELQSKARSLGLSLALIFRLILLSAISWMASLTEPLFSVFEKGISWRDLILLGGGLFLIYKSTKEMFEKLEEASLEKEAVKEIPSFASVVGQIIVIDIIFSIDSIITAIGLVSSVGIMMIAVVCSMIVMLLFSGKISAFIEEHPSLKVLALSFLLMIGTLLIAEAFGFHIPKGYVYFAMAFSIGVESINIRYRKKIKHGKPNA